MFTWAFNLKQAIENVSVLTKALGAMGAGSVTAILINAAYTDRAVSNAKIEVEKQHEVYVASHAKQDDLIKSNLEQAQRDDRITVRAIMSGMETQNQNMFALQQTFLTGRYHQLKPLKFKKPAIEPETKGD